MRRADLSEYIGIVLLALACSVGLSAQPAMGPSPVGFTEARSYRLHESLRLPGSVVSQKISTVASEVGGLVVELPVEKGQQVEQGQMIARLRQQALQLRLAAAKAQLKEDKARKEFAEVNLKRMRELLADAVISQQDLDDAQTEFNAWQGRLERLEAEIDQIHDQLERSVIRAPFDGVVVDKFSEVGEWVDVGGQVVELLSLRDLEVEVDVPQRYFGRLRLDGWAPVVFEAPGLEIRCKIVALIPRADPQSRTFPMRLRLPASERRVGAGMEAHVLIPVGSVYDAVVVPKDAVLTDTDVPRVYRVREDETVEPVSVEMGKGVGSWVEVRGGLSVGDRVVTRGNERLRPGQKVEVFVVEYALP